MCEAQNDELPKRAQRETAILRRQAKRDKLRRSVVAKSPLRDTAKQYLVALLLVVDTFVSLLIVGQRTWGTSASTTGQTYV